MTCIADRPNFALGDYAWRRPTRAPQTQGLGSDAGGQVSAPLGRGSRHPRPRVLLFPIGPRLNVGMKKAKRKTKSPRASSAVDAYIGARMRESRLALNMTQADLGEKLGVTFQQIQKYESVETA